MSDRRLAAIVIGPESSGTRVVTRLLLYMGFYGDGGHAQRIDERIPNIDRLVWRRSYPHGGEWPDIGGMVGSFKRMGYEIRVIVTVRDWLPMIRSQIQAGHTDTPDVSERQLQNALVYIMRDVAALEVPFCIVTYCGLVNHHADLVPWLADWLGVIPPSGYEDIYDADVKHWERRDFL